jgi:hypothetical protein
VNEYRVIARLHATSFLSEERFREHLAALARKLERFGGEVAGFPARYEIAIRAPATSAADAEQLWWREVEPVLESERLGSDTAIYASLPRAMVAVRS